MSPTELEQPATEKAEIVNSTPAELLELLILVDQLQSDNVFFSQAWSEDSL